MPGRKPANERFAEAFALCFLLPATSVRQKFHDIVATTGDFQVADLCRMKHFYFVSLEAMTIRVEQLGLIPKGNWDSLKESTAGQTLTRTLTSREVEPSGEKKSFRMPFDTSLLGETRTG
jgi:Zn-dependent peptidase ImmA (M78 family)